MALKGTKYSDVNFSIPEGADPLGIGELDLGKSSYDPIESIRRTWETARQERLIKDKERREDYQSFVASLPKVGAFNDKISRDLNKEITDMQDLAYRAYKAGNLAEFVKKGRDRKGAESVTQELNRRQRDVMAKVQAYDTFKGIEAKAQAILNDPTKKDLIDEEETNKRMWAIHNAKNFDEMSQAFSQFPVAFKPTPIDINKKVGEKLDFYLKNAGVNVDISRIYDPLTGKIQITETSGVSQDMVDKAMIKVYRDIVQENPLMAKEIKKRYEASPMAEKMTEGKEGLLLDEESWFVGRYSPMYDKKIKQSYQTIDEGPAGAKKQTVNPEVTPDGMVYRMGTKSVSSNYEVEVYTPDGKLEKKSLNDADIVEVGYGKLPDGSLGKYVLFHNKIKTPNVDGKMETSIEPEIVPWNKIKNSVLDKYTLPKLNEFETLPEIKEPEKLPEIKMWDIPEVKGDRTMVGRWLKGNPYEKALPDDPAAKKLIERIKSTPEYSIMSDTEKAEYVYRNFKDKADKIEKFINAPKNKGKIKSLLHAIDILITLEKI